MSDRSLQLIRTLRPEGRTAAVWLINQLRAAGIPAIVVSARRSVAHQRQLIAAGKTTATRSRHLQGRAMDIDLASVPRGSDAWHEWLEYAGSLWESIGGRWGGRFRDDDPIHFDW